MTLTVVFGDGDKRVEFERIGFSVWVSLFRQDGDELVEETRELEASDVYRSLRILSEDEEEG